MQWKHPGSPLLSNLRLFFQQGRGWPLSLSGCYHGDYLEKSHKINGVYDAEN